MKILSLVVILASTLFFAGCQSGHTSSPTHITYITSDLDPYASSYHSSSATDATLYTNDNTSHVTDESTYMLIEGEELIGSPLLLPNTPPTPEHYEEYYKQIVFPYQLAGLIFDEWNKPDDILVEKLIKFYEFNVYFNSSYALTDNPSKVFITATNVERYIQRYFDVSLETLHAWKDYDSELNYYKFYYDSGIGSIPLKIANITELDDKLIIEMIYLDADDSCKYDKTKLVILKNGDSFKYISNTPIENNNYYSRD